MAHHRIVRDDGYRNPRETPTDDEDDGPEVSSFPNKHPFDTSTTYPPEVTAIPTDIPTSIKTYSSKMSDGPNSWESDDQGPWERPSGSGRPFWVTNDYSTYRGGPSPTPTTLSTKTALGDHNGVQSPTAAPTPTRPADDTSSPAPTNDEPPNLQNHVAVSGPKTPMYAAAGITPVVVIIIGFFVFLGLRRRRRQRQAAAVHGHIEEMKMQLKPVALPYIAPITPPSPPPAVLPQYSPSTPSTPSSSHLPTASSSQPVILGPIPSGNNGAYLTGMDTSDLVSMTSAGNISRQGTVVDRDPFADGRSLEEAPPPYRPSSLPPASLASPSRNSSVRMAAPPHMTSRTQLIDRSPFDDPEDDEVSELSGPTLGRSTDAMSDISDLSYQVDPVVGRSPF